jgi:hypothetical protein
MLSQDASSPAVLCLHPCGIVVLGPEDPRPPLKGCRFVEFSHPPPRSVLLASRIFSGFSIFIAIFTVFRSLQSFAELRVDLEKRCFFLRRYGTVSNVGFALGAVAGLSTFVGLLVVITLLRSVILSGPFLVYLKFWVFDRMGLMVLQLLLWTAVSLYFIITGDGGHPSAIQDVKSNLAPVIVLFTVGFPAIDFLCLLRGVPQSTYTVLRFTNVVFLMFALSWRAQGSTFFMGCDAVGPKEAKNIVLFAIFEVLCTSVLIRYLAFSMRKFLRPKSPSCDTHPLSTNLFIDPQRQKGDTELTILNKA